MKTKIGFLLVAFIMAFTTSTFAKEKVKQTVVFSVKMDCGSCKNKIEKNISFEKGVTDLNVNMQSQTVTVEFREDKTNIENLISAFKKLGFDATVVEKESSPKVDHSDCSAAGHKH